jgi:uncharacterized phiE125 gp8 family phage protein
MADETINTNTLADLDELKRYMDITGSTDDDDDELVATLNRISKAMETYCDRKFYIQERTEYYRGTGTNTLVLYQYPITSVSGVWISTSRTWDATTLTASSDYFINNNANALIMYNSDFTAEEYENIRVIYSAGLFSSTATVPADLKMACLKEASRMYRTRNDKGYSSRSSDSAGGVDTVSFITAEFTPETLSILQRYRAKRIYS